MLPPSLKTDAKSFRSVEHLEFVFSHPSKRANSGRDAELEARSRECCAQLTQLRWPGQCVWNGILVSAARLDAPIFGALWSRWIPG